MQPLIKLLQSLARAETIRFYNRTPAYRDVGEWETFINTIISNTVRRASEEALKSIKVICSCGDEMDIEPDERFKVYGTRYYCLGCDQETFVQTITTPTETLETNK